jgi:hypothetical protein
VPSVEEIVQHVTQWIDGRAEQAVAEVMHHA